MSPTNMMQPRAAANMRRHEFEKLLTRLPGEYDGEFRQRQDAHRRLWADLYPEDAALLMGRYGGDALLSSVSTTTTSAFGVSIER